MGSSNEPTWRTAISDAREESIVFRGYDIEDLVGEYDFVSVMYLVLTGGLPTEEESTVFNALLAAGIDHGISPSQAVTRYISAGGVEVPAAVAGGILTIGEHHGGGAGERTAWMYLDALENCGDRSIDEVAADLVKEYLDSDKNVPGYGHPMHPRGDPRASILIDVADDSGVLGETTELALAIEDELVERTGYEFLKLNYNGVRAALMLEIGFEPEYVRALSLLTRPPGLVAHALEERHREDWWRVPEGETVYDGPDDREVPDKD